MAAVQGQFTLPLLAFQHHVGKLYIDPAEIQFAKGLGQSDLCIVEQGRWKGSNGRYTNIVCKVWRPFVVATPQDFRELLLEAAKLHRLQHPNITRFLGLGCFAHGSLAEVRESMFMVEEYVGERTLRKLISEQMRCRHKNLFDMRAALRWACQIASALAALHDQQPAYVHNDVKADNVFLTDVSQNMFLSDTARVGASDAKLGDLKPHRHVYDREPSTLSLYQQQQQRQHSPKASHPGTLQPPRYSLERNSGCSSTGSGERRLSWSSTASSTVAGAIQSGGQQQQQQQQQGKVQFVSASLACKTSSIGAKSSKQQQQWPKTPAFLHASNAFTLDGDSSWSSACSTVTPTADAVAAVTPAVASAATDTDAKPPASPAAAAAAQSEGVTRVRSLPVPIAARGSHAFRGSSCPTNWNPGLDGQSTVTDCVGSPSAAAQGSPGYASADSQCSYSSFNSASVCNSSSTVAGLSTCANSAPPATCSLAAEIAAADAAAAAAEAASAAAEGAEGSRSGWRALTRQRSSSANGRLSDSASSTGGGGKGGASKGGSGSLAADVDAEDSSDRSAEAAADISGAEVPAARHSIEDLDSPRQQQQQQQGRRGLAKGALATAFAHVKQDSHHQPQQQQQQQQHEAVAGPDLASSPPDVGQAAPSSPQKRLLGMFYKRSKSSPLEDDGVHHPHMQLARSAPDVTHRDIDDEAVHHGALLMPLQLSEPTGLCSLQSADTSPDRPHTSSAAAAVEAQHAKQAAAHRQQLQHAKSQPISSSHSSIGAAGGDSCVYYGWELLPSGAASPCGAVHSSMLDLFADVTGDDVVTSRRYRDSCHYTLVPGSFVQQRSPLSVSSAGPAAITRSKSTPASWDAGAVAASAGISSSNSSSQVTFAASAGSKWTPATLLQLQQQQQQQGSELERAPSIGKGCAPTAIESKQHGGNSAFAALTAIDCIAEEGSSIATDSCAPSCSASRESSARDGSYFYRTPTLSTRGSAEAPPTPQQQASLVTAGSLTKALGLSLLRSRSGGARSSGSGGLTEDDRQDSSRTRSPPASPRDCSAHSVGSSSPQSPSPSKKHLLQLLVAASGGSLGSGDITTVPQHQTPLDQNAGYCPWKQVQFDQQQLPQQADSSIAALQGADPAAAAAAAAAAAPAKKVRFSLARPSGLTASRDYGLVYAAPELVRGERPTEKVDVFAFGVLLYELLSRKLVASSVAEVCARNSSRRGSRHSKHSKSMHKQQQQQQQVDADLNSGSNSDCSTLVVEVPEHQLLLQYAQLVAGGYRPPMLPHFPAPVVQLISSCWAAEPHERPRMSEVLLELQSWGKNRPLMSALNAYVLALADMGYTGRAAAQPGCGCVIS